MCNLDRFLIWVDAVGGYWVCLGDEVLMGQPVQSDQVDIPLLGDLSGRHARIRRDGEGYLIEAIKAQQAQIETLQAEVKSLKTQIKVER